MLNLEFSALILEMKELIFLRTEKMSLNHRTLSNKYMFIQAPRFLLSTRRMDSDN